MATVVPAHPRFSTHKALYAVDPLSSETTKLSADNGWTAPDESSLVSILVLSHSGKPEATEKRGMVMVWAQLSQPQTRSAGAMSNLVLAMPPAAVRRSSATQLLGSNVDDPTQDIARRLTSRFKRPIYLSLNNVGSSRASAAASGSMMSMVAASHMEELPALEKCLVDELKCVFSV
ncbi:hypothetical protein H4S08_003558 [Coemansia sp. RSA 1365]|nr:hypothetical protein H4S08_003558 [Coemansia sp. RSA 1365]